MNIAVLSSDKVLMNFVKNHESLQQAVIEEYDKPQNMRDQLEVNVIDTVILSDSFFTFPELCEYIESIRERRKEIRILILMTSHPNEVDKDKLIKYCMAQQICYVPPKYTAEQLADEIVQFVYNRPDSITNRGNVVLFLGSTPNIGTTIVSFCTAMEIAKSTNQSIGYLCLNLKSSKIHRYLGVEEPRASLDELRAKIKAQSLTAEQLIQTSIRVKQAPNLHVLAGNVLREQAEYYSVEDIQYVLDTASSAFDLCIVEVSSYWDNAATIYGVIHADTKILVSTSQLSHFQEDINRWARSVSPIFDLDIQDFDLFITQLEKKQLHFQSFGLKDIRKETGMNIVGYLPRLEVIEEILDEGKLHEAATVDSRVGKSLKSLVNMLSALHNIDCSQQNMKKRWLHRILASISS